MGSNDSSDKSKGKTDTAAGKGKFRDGQDSRVEKGVFREGQKTWNVEPVKQTAEPPPRPKK